MFLPSGCEAFMYIHEQEASWPQRLRVTGFAWFWASDGNTEKFTHLISIHEHLVPPHTPIPWLYCTVEVDGGKESSKEPNSHPSPPQAWKASAKIGNFVLHRTAASIYADYNGFHCDRFSLMREDDSLETSQSPKVEPLNCPSACCEYISPHEDFNWTVSSLSQ